MDTSSFREIVERSINDNKLSKAACYLKNNASLCKTDPSSISRLYNYLSTYNMVDEINDCFLALIKEAYIFDSSEYIQPLKTLINADRP